MKRANLFIPEGASQIIDLLGMMMLSSPTFKDKTGRFPYRNVDVVFHQLNESLARIRSRLGEERYSKLIEMSDEMRAHFEADPEKKTGDTLKGRVIIDEMMRLLKRSARKS